MKRTLLCIVVGTVVHVLVACACALWSDGHLHRVVSHTPPGPATTGTSDRLPDGTRLYTPAPARTRQLGSSVIERHGFGFVYELSRDEYPPPQAEIDSPYRTGGHGSGDGTQVFDFTAAFPWDAEHPVALRVGWPFVSLEADMTPTSSPEDASAIRRGFSLDRVPRSRAIGTRRLPIKPSWPGFLYNTIVYSLIPLVLLQLGHHARRTGRISRGRCAKCGYALFHQSRCPECGREAHHAAQQGAGVDRPPGEPDGPPTPGASGFA